jgi:hypothetical protein
MRCVKSVAYASMFVASMMAAAGCGSGAKPSAEVSGTIKLNGKAPDLDGLTICFLAADGRPVVFDVSKDGTFKGSGVSLGENKLSLYYSPPSNQPSLSQKKTKERGANAMDDAPGTPAPKNPIPEQFRDSQKTPKTFTIEAGKDNIVMWDVSR